MDKNVALLVAGIVFGIVSFLHLYRLVTNSEFSVGGKSVPLWLSALGCLFTGSMSFWMLMAR